MSRRGDEWKRFAEEVWLHIETYTVPQYGDFPDDQATTFSDGQCLDQIKRYANRYGRNSRGDAEELRDLLKIAHYACLAFAKRAEWGAD